MNTDELLNAIFTMIISIASQVVPLIIQAIFDLISQAMAS